MGNHSQPQIRISVRNLVEFVMRSGDLDNRRTAGAKKEAMQAGSRLHRKIQKRMGASYRSEVMLRYQVQEDMFDILVEGRADGIITEPAGVTIDEIKCIYMDVSRLEEPEPVHLAQALCYGWFYSIQKELDSVGIQITYCNIETEEIRRFKEVRSFEELKSWFEGLIHEYVKWARYLYHHGIRRQECLKELPFPYPYREGQKELAGNVYRSIARKRNLFIQAPTGVGKTLSTIYPSLKAMGEGHGEKLFYLTAKTITRSVAEEAFSILRREGHLYFNTVTITAKEKLCVMEKPDCNPQACPRAKGHYDRVNDAVYEIIQEVDGITRDKVLEYAQRYQICPFEFCLDISNWVDGIICDYNYVFDPNVRLKRYFDQGEPGQGCLFLVDEAHNLVPRAREMYSASLIKEDVLLTKRILKTQTGSGKVIAQLDKCNQRLLELKRSYGVDEGGRRTVLGSAYELLPDVNALALNLMTMFGELETFMNENIEFTDRDLVLEFYFAVRDFLYVYDRLDEHYRIYDQILTDGSFMVKLLCINPAANLKECLDKGVSTLFFSATLLPIQYYKELLSGNQEEYAVYAKSPFPQENRMVLAASDVSSRYSRRGPSEYEKIVDYICRVVEGKKGNYMVFCPSYQYLHAIEDILAAREASGALSFIWNAQTNHMTEEDREAFLQSFDEERDCSMAALCVMGRIFSEGIDLKEDRLIGAVIIGTGLPQVNTEQEILKEYFDEQGEHGFDYAYQYPGMNKVMQAAGRVIRTIRDRGIIALLDDRFLRPEYVALFPREWGTYTVVNRYNVDQAVRAFWDGTK
ncbi:ATP-dependent DNA helicase [Enterocloster clostridioformis]|uniref:ATP-dependent DNA helicase n=1 Tax=Enterocloster clostridioformis TaxID=1531 RepID=UPI00406876A5